MKINRYFLGGLLGGIIILNKLRKQKRYTELSGKIVLVTGGSRGLGLVMARQLCQAGARLAICARDREHLDKASSQLAAITSDFLSIQCDVSNKDEVNNMIGQIRQQWGEVEILINNAGIIQAGPMESMQEEDYQRSLDVHFWGPFNLIHEVLPGMRKAGTGRIVNIASMNAKVSFPHLLPYTVGKYALSGFSEGITAELSKYGIRVTSVYPGLMRTGSPRNVDVKGQHEKEYAWFKIADSLPGLSMNAEKAASTIIEAMQYGRKVLKLSLPAKIAIAMEGLAPGATLSLFQFADSLLPASDHSGDTGQKGYESESDITQSILTKKTDKAEKKNNQF